jgi:hypothetical protein
MVARGGGGNKRDCTSRQFPFHERRVFRFHAIRDSLGQADIFQGYGGGPLIREALVFAEYGSRRAAAQAKTP